MEQPAIELDRIAKIYGRTAALRSISLSLAPGETLALLGPNGSGKTTLLKILAGAIAPTLGRGRIFGRDIARERIHLRTEVGMLAAESYLYDDLSAYENLRFTLTMAGQRADANRLKEVLKQVDLDGHADARVRSFSSGMKRRLSLARILLQQPRLLLLDEPYNSLDAAGADLVDEIVRTVASNGFATVLATHDADRALALADVVAVLDRGALVSLRQSPRYERMHRAMESQVGARADVAPPRGHPAVSTSV